MARLTLFLMPPLTQTRVRIGFKSRRVKTRNVTLCINDKSATFDFTRVRIGFKLRQVRTWNVELCVNDKIASFDFTRVKIGFKLRWVRTQNVALCVNDKIDTFSYATFDSNQGENWVQVATSKNPKCRVLRKWQDWHFFLYHLWRKPGWELVSSCDK